LNTDGSQFYLVPSDSTPSHLDWIEGKDCSTSSCHTVYGQVISGQDVVDAISEVATASGGDKPTQDVRVISVVRS
jgi:cyclophilin family peptidyl-prolyl cis-trans isomerase